MKVKIINFEGVKRVIFGEMVNDIDIDYTKSLTALKSDLEYVIPILAEHSKSKDKFAFMKRNTIKNRVRVHQGTSHLDVVDDGVGSLNWLRIEDHKVDH